MYDVTYRLDRGAPCDFHDIVITTDHRPELGHVTLVPDGSGRYGRVISVERHHSGGSTGAES
jgi:hypothetical protein